MYVYTRCLFGHYGSYFVYIYDAPNKLFKDKKKKVTYKWPGKLRLPPGCGGSGNRVMDLGVRLLSLPIMSSTPSSTLLEIVYYVTVRGL